MAHTKEDEGHGDRGADDGLGGDNAGRRRHDGGEQLLCLMLVMVFQWTR